MSNYWKKPAPHNLKYNDSFVIAPQHSGLPFILKHYIYEGQIAPNIMIKNRKAYDIVQIHPMLIINGFCVTTENDRVHSIIIFGMHPNKDPDTNLFCLPEFKVNKIFTETYFNLLVKNIETYYLDNAYYQPPAKYVTYKPLKSIYLELHDDEGEHINECPEGEKRR